MILYTTSDPFVKPNRSSSKKNLLARSIKRKSIFSTFFIKKEIHDTDSDLTRYEFTQKIVT